MEITSTLTVSIHDIGGEEKAGELYATLHKLLNHPLTIGRDGFAIVIRPQTAHDYKWAARIVHQFMVKTNAPITV